MSPRVTLSGESASAYRGFIGILFIGLGIGLIIGKIEDPESSFWLIVIALGFIGLAYYHLRRSHIYCGWKYIIWGLVVRGITTGVIWAISQSDGSTPSARSENILQLAQAGGQSTNFNITSTVKPVKTLTKEPLFTPTSAPTCQLWNEITLADLGRNTCVYGTVKNTFSRDGAFLLYSEVTLKIFISLIMEKGGMKG